MVAGRDPMFSIKQTFSHSRLCTTNYICNAVVVVFPYVRTVTETYLSPS